MIAVKIKPGRWWLKGCSRCGGDLYSYDENYGDNGIRCLCCGIELSQEKIRKLVENSPSKPIDNP